MFALQGPVVHPHVVAKLSREQVGKDPESCRWGNCRGIASHRPNVTACIWCEVKLENILCGVGLPTFSQMLLLC